MPSPLFIAATEADSKVINMLLLYLRDWEYGGSTAEYDSFRIINGRNPASLVPTSRGEVAPSSPPIAASMSNDWQGASIPEVEAFCLRLASEGPKEQALNHRLFLALDAQGVREKTVVLGERVIEDEDTEEEDDSEHKGLPEISYSDKFNKTRIPWHRAYLDWTNLDIGNMDFLEMVDEGSGPSENGWWEYSEAVGEEIYLSEENRIKRDDEIKRLRGSGHI